MAAAPASQVDTTPTHPGVRVDASAPVAKVAPATPTVPTQPQDSPWQQVMSVLRPVRKFADGSHRLSIQIHPEELGSVTVELAMHQGQLSLHLVAEKQSTADLLSASMAELRADIDRDGHRQSLLEVAQQFADERQTRRNQESEKVPASYLAPVAVASTLPSSESSDGRIDLRM